MPALQNSVQPVQKGKIFWTAQMPCGCCYVQLVQFVQGNKTPTINAPAFRPSRPHVCRKRREASRLNPADRYASLDPSRLASGQKNSRAMNGNSSGGGSEQKYPRKEKETGARPRFAPHFSYLLPRFCLIADQGSRPFVAGALPVFDQKAFRFAPEPSPFCVSMFSVFGCRRERFSPTALPFSSDRFSVFLRPMQRSTSPPVYSGRMGIG